MISMKEKVTEYETVETQREQIISDLSGEPIEDGKEIELHANPGVEITDPGKMRRSLQAQIRDVGRKNTHSYLKSHELDNQTRTFIKKFSKEVDVTSQGRIHVSKSEFATLSGIDPGTFDEGQSIPKVLVQEKEPAIFKIIDMENKYTRRMIGFILMVGLMSLGVIFNSSDFVFIFGTLSILSSLLLLHWE